LYISKTTKNLSLLDTFHHFSAVQQVHKITQVESTRKWTSGITDNIIISSNYKLNTKRIFSISYLSYLLCRHSCIAAARRAPLHYCPSCHCCRAASCCATAALLHIMSQSRCRLCRRRDRSTACRVADALPPVPPPRPWCCLLCRRRAAAHAATAVLPCRVTVTLPLVPLQQPRRCLSCHSHTASRRAAGRCCPSCRRHADPCCAVTIGTP